MFEESRNRFQEIASASLCSFRAGTIILFVVQARQAIHKLAESIPGLLKRSQFGVRFLEKFFTVHTQQIQLKAASLPLVVSLCTALCFFSGSLRSLVDIIMYEVC
jgi:hypothetical protein